MTLTRRWVARCDQNGCDVTVVLDPISDGNRWDYGIEINDLGWQAGPKSEKTYCPAHWQDDWDEKKGGE